MSKNNNLLDGDRKDDSIFTCDKCGRVVSSEDDLFPYEDMYVCADCFDKLNRDDITDYMEEESDGMEDYEE